MATNWYETIKRFFDKGLWDERKVQQAVEKGLITQEQADEILKGE